MISPAPSGRAGISPSSLAVDIKDRLSQEIIIALVGPVGSGVSTAANFIKQILENDFQYSVCPIIKPSDIIRDEAHRVGIYGLPHTPLEKYITALQNAGNALREKFGGHYLAEKAVERICKYRRENGGYSGDDVPVAGRRAYIIDSLKNPEELSLLKQIYSDTLIVFGVYAPDSVRATRLKDNGVPESSVTAVLDRDKGEVATFGQKTRKLFVRADFFLSNDHKKDELRVRIERFLDLIFNSDIRTPTKAEWAMYEASSASANSACMSRQVGASILSSSGELISVGWNDVPRFGGGLYNEDDRSVWDAEKHALVDKDHRCFKWGACICHNETRKQSIVEKIARQISSKDVLKRGKGYEDIKSLLAGTDIDSLIEFSRSIHAEMEAILAVAREGRHSLVNATLYTTTYPCHNCARHIVAAGIVRVVYIEPYDKSLATELHPDSVSENPDDKSHVIFEQFGGVAPRLYHRLFKSEFARKERGKVVALPKNSALPIFQVPLDSPADYEAKVIADLSDKEHNEA